MNKHLSYLKYVLKHKWYTLIECIKLGITWRGIVHDLSRFRRDEWTARATYLFGGESPRDATGYPSGKSSSDAYKVSIHGHHQRNPHHWQWWVWNRDDGSKTVLPMSSVYRREMLADMRGAGRAQGKPDITAYYQANKDKMQLHSKTREWLELHLEAE